MEEKEKEPVIPIDPLCRMEIDPFFDDIRPDGDDPFMRRQHEIEFSEIAGFPEDAEHSASSWRGSKELICCKIYYDESRKHKNGLLVWCRAAVRSEKGEQRRLIEVNLVELILSKQTDSDQKGLQFDPSKVESYRLKRQCLIPVVLKHANGQQLRLKTQLHPTRPLLFIFCRQSVTAGYTSVRRHVASFSHFEPRKPRK